MSVQCNQYVAYGFMLDFTEAREHLIKTLGEEGYEDLSDKYHDNAFKPDIVEVHGCSMIEDGMGGKYTFFGKIYAKSSNYEPLESMVIPKEIPIKDAIITEHEFKRLFGIDFNVEPQLHLIAHYR